MQSELEIPNTDKDEQRIYIGSINPHLTSKNLIKYFSKKNLKLRLQIKKGKRQKNYMIAIAENKATFNQLTSIEKNHEIGEYKFTTDVYLKGKQKLLRDQEISKKRIYVGNLPQMITDQELKKYFEIFGKVKMAYISKKKKNDSKLFGFVTFQKERVAQILIEARKLFMNGRKLIIKGFRAKGLRQLPRNQEFEFKGDERHGSVDPDRYILGQSGGNLFGGRNSLLLERDWFRNSRLKEEDFSLCYNQESLIQFINFRHFFRPQNLRLN